VYAGSHLSQCKRLHFGCLNVASAMTVRRPRKTQVIRDPPDGYPQRCGFGVLCMLVSLGMRLGRLHTGPESGYGWLSAVIPADARRFRVADPALAGVLRDTGAEATDVMPDVEIAPVRQLGGDARSRSRYLVISATKRDRFQCVRDADWSLLR
jgi:hypothetical protein